MCNALTILCGSAHAHIIGQVGNPGEVSKRESCWESFRETSSSIGETWRVELAETPFVAATSDDDALAAEWETVRAQFRNDERMIAALEAVTGKQWIAKRRRDPVATYANATWAELRNKGGLGPVRLRGLLELFAAAAERSP